MLNKQVYKIILPSASRDLLIACHDLHRNSYSRSGKGNKTWIKQESNVIKKYEER